jgi:hypothetical protein
MTIKRYEPRIIIGIGLFGVPEKRYPGMISKKKGNYIKVYDAIGRLEDILSLCQYTPEAFSHEIRTLIKELK